MTDEQKSFFIDLFTVSVAVVCFVVVVVVVVVVFDIAFVVVVVVVGALVELDFLGVAHLKLKSESRRHSIK